MANAYKVLVIDDEESILRLLQHELSTEERIVDTASSATLGLEKFSKGHYDVVVSDIRLPDGDGLDMLVQFKTAYPDIEVVLITGHGNIDNAVEAMRIGAYDYLTKPFHLDRVELVIERAYQRVCLQRENRSFRHSDQAVTSTKLVGNSAPIKQIKYLIGKVAPTDVAVLITGESGVGKDVVAHSIQEQSERSERPFIVKNCATLQKELMRSELFGHTRGSFTGATDNRDGLMTYADTGTLFLDEIGELPLEVQGGLLRVLEAKMYRRMGEKNERHVDIRFLFATSRNLAEEVEAGRFNEALYHRINVFNIPVPPLCQRKEDIPLLVEHFLGRMSIAMRRERLTITDKAVQCLTQYEWPGNIRELRNVLERSIILAEGGVITNQALPRELVERVADQSDGTVFSLEELEREHIQRALQFYDGNRLQAAKALGIGRKTLYRKIEKFGLS
ncbi:sigma-54 dependent transcriptional regulator [Desulfovibrio sp. Huiquan2017]|uniref:sigma-54-dependent transcriptional regulator n=1 Tax=Desulfovibrio sp. Huiquan2017 TaxID=2816861 RepID=UPI001A93282D|nr:sigma-54 dependent transcriptional regulator [Desulfovibrio sp. Huiquan2017]